MQNAPLKPDFCADSALGYDRSRSVFNQGEAFRLDDAYRLAHLPLVNPSHPDVIANTPGKSYEMETELHQQTGSYNHTCHVRRNEARVVHHL